MALGREIKSRVEIMDVCYQTARCTFSFFERYSAHVLASGYQIIDIEVFPNIFARVVILDGRLRGVSLIGNEAVERL